MYRTINWILHSYIDVAGGTLLSDERTDGTHSRMYAEPPCYTRSDLTDLGERMRLEGDGWSVLERERMDSMKRIAEFAAAEQKRVESIMFERKKAESERHQRESEREKTQRADAETARMRKEIEERERIREEKLKKEKAELDLKLQKDKLAKDEQERDRQNKSELERRNLDSEMRLQSFSLQGITVIKSNSFQSAFCFT